MYLSRLILDPRSPRVRREVSEPYEMHRTLMIAFPDAAAGGPGRVLFRVDALPETQLQRAGLCLLVQSEHEPDWEPVVGKPGYLLHSHANNPAVKVFQPVLMPGQRLAFRLRANPTVKRAGRRRGLLREEEQRAWLERKAAVNGFRVLTVTVAREGRVGGAIHRDDESHNLCLLAVRFDGIMEVTDPLRCLEAVRQGIGSGKGLGFGLLSLARWQV